MGTAGVGVEDVALKEDASPTATEAKEEVEEKEEEKGEGKDGGGGDEKVWKEAIGVFDVDGHRIRILSGEGWDRRRREFQGWVDAPGEVAGGGVGSDGGRIEDMAGETRHG